MRDNKKENGTWVGKCQHYGMGEGKGEEGRRGGREGRKRGGKEGRRRGRREGWIKTGDYLLLQDRS